MVRLYRQAKERVVAACKGQGHEAALRDEGRGCQWGENVKYVFRHDIPIKIRAELGVEELHDEVADDGVVEQCKKGRVWSVR